MPTPFRLPGKRSAWSFAVVPGGRNDGCIVFAVDKTGKGQWPFLVFDGSSEYRGVQLCWRDGSAVEKLHRAHEIYRFGNELLFKTHFQNAAGQSKNAFWRFDPEHSRAVFLKADVDTDYICYFGERLYCCTEEGVGYYPSGEDGFVKLGDVSVDEVVNWCVFDLEDGLGRRPFLALKDSRVFEVKANSLQRFSAGDWIAQLTSICAVERGPLAGIYLAGSGDLLVYKAEEGDWDSVALPSFTEGEPKEPFELHPVGLEGVVVGFAAPSGARLKDCSYYLLKASRGTWEHIVDTVKPVYEVGFLKHKWYLSGRGIFAKQGSSLCFQL